MQRESLQTDEQFPLWRVLRGFLEAHVERVAKSSVLSTRRWDLLSTEFDRTLLYLRTPSRELCPR